MLRLVGFLQFFTNFLPVCQTVCVAGSVPGNYKNKKNHNKISKCIYMYMYLASHLIDSLVILICTTQHNSSVKNAIYFYIFILFNN